MDYSILSKVIGATNRGNVELSMAIFHSQSGYELSFIDIETNQKTKYM